MNENEIEKELMDWYVSLATNNLPNEKCLETAQQFDKLADCYKGIVDHHQKKVDHYRDLQQMAKTAAEANRKLAMQ
jgi:hypothetical protein